MEIAIPMAENVYGEICTRARDHELDSASIAVVVEGKVLDFRWNCNFRRIPEIGI